MSKIARSIWKNIDIFSPVNLNVNSKRNNFANNHEDELFYKGRWQELITKEYDKAPEWLINLFDEKNNLTL